MKHPFLAFVLGTATLLSGASLHASSNYATHYTFTTLAGKAEVHGSDDGQGSHAELTPGF